MFGDDLVAAVPAVPRVPHHVHREPDPGAPQGAVGRTAGHLLDGHLAVHPTEPAQLLGHHRARETALRLDGHVREVAATRPSRTGDRADSIDAVLGRLEHVLHVGEAERPAPILGDPSEDPLPRQSVPHEHDAPLEPRDTRTTVGGIAEDHLDPPAGPIRARVCLTIHRGSSSLSNCRSCPFGAARPTAPASADERSCQGTLVTITPGWKRSRLLSRRALWL